MDQQEALFVYLSASSSVFWKSKKCYFGIYAEEIFTERHQIWIIKNP